MTATLLIIISIDVSAYQAILGEAKTVYPIQAGIFYDEKQGIYLTVLTTQEINWIDDNTLEIISFSRKEYIRW